MERAAIVSCGFSKKTVGLGPVGDARASNVFVGLIFQGNILGRLHAVLGAWNGPADAVRRGRERMHRAAGFQCDIHVVRLLARAVFVGSCLSASG
jgi:hypothetical protein